MAGANGPGQKGSKMKDPMNIRALDDDTREALEEFYLRNQPATGWGPYQYAVAAGWALLVILTLIAGGIGR